MKSSTTLLVPDLRTKGQSSSNTSKGSIEADHLLLASISAQTLLDLSWYLKEAVEQYLSVRMESDGEIQHFIYEKLGVGYVTNLTEGFVEITTGLLELIEFIPQSGGHDGGRGSASTSCGW